MARKKKQQECPAGEKWAVPYADFLSLLLALFIALYAISSVNKSKVEALKTEFVKIFDATPMPEAPQPVITIPPNPGEEIKPTDGSKTFQSNQNASSVAVENIAQLEKIIEKGGVLEQVEQGITLKLPANLIFKAGSADIANSDMLMYIKRISQIIKKLPSQVNVNVRGYTDDSPLPNNSEFKDDYALGAARASAVLKAMIQDGVPANQLSFSSYGKYQPIVPNDTLENKAKNNRVEIFLSANPDNIKKIKSVLDKEPSSK